MQRYTPLDLEPYCNHQVFLRDHPKTYRSHLPNGGLADVYFTPLPYHEFGIKACINGVPFIFPAVGPERYDNVACEEQTISGIDRQYTELHLLGFGEYGDSADNMTLKYANGTSTAVSFFVYDCRRGSVG